MSTVRKMLEAKKAKLLEEAQKRAAEIDHDMAELERLTEKYGLDVKGEQAAAESAMGMLDRALRRQPESPISTTAQSRAEAEAYIRQKGRPVPLNEIYEMLEAKGIKFQSDNARNTLSAVLGQSENLYSISREKGWWIKGVPEPATLKLHG